MAEKKKKRGCLTSLIVIVFIIGLIVGGGWYYLNQNKPEEVVYTQNDLDSFYEKADIEPGAYDFKLTDFLQGNVDVGEPIELEATFTSEEITALLQSVEDSAAVLSPAFVFLRSFSLPGTMEVYAESDVITGSDFSGTGIFSNINVRFTGPGQMEVFASPTEGFKAVYDYVPELQSFSFAIDQVIGSTVYAAMNVSYRGSLNLDVTSANLNGVPLPMDMINNYEGQFAKEINGAIHRIEGLTIESLEINSNGFTFKGTVPSYIRSK